MKSPLSSVAFCAKLPKVSPMRRAAAAALGLAIVMGGFAHLSAQGPPPPAGEGPGDRPPKSGQDGRDRDRDYDRDRDRERDGKSGYGRGGVDRDRMDAFRSMSDEEKQRVRNAFDKAWQNPEVTAARERYMKANDEYRATLQKALKEADPTVVDLLEKHKPKGGPPGMMPMPDPNDPEFSKKAVNRLGMELHALSRMENRKFPTKEIGEKVMSDPGVKAAVQRMEAAEPAGRMEAWRKLVIAFQEVARKEMPVQEGGRRPGPPGPRFGDGPRPEDGRPGPGPGPGPEPAPGPKPQ
jgi:hypothetical protein